MGRSTDARTTVLLVSAALLVAACGGGAGSGDAKDAARVPGITTEGGDVVVEQDGSTFRSGHDLPDDWPEELALPEGASLASASESSRGGGGSATVSATSDELTVEQVVEHFRAGLDGWRATASSDAGTGEARVANRAWRREREAATLTASRQMGRTVIVVTLTTEDAG